MKSHEKVANSDTGNTWNLQAVRIWRIRSEENAVPAYLKSVVAFNTAQRDLRVR